MKKILILIAILFTFYGCSDENPVDGIETDQRLKSSIIGSWNFGGEKYVFNADDEFIDSAFTTNGSNKILFYVRRGRYEINKSVLTLKTQQWKFYNTTYTQGLSIIPDDYLIEINNGKMTWESVEIFAPKNHQTNNIYGEWETTKWVFRNTSEVGYSFYYGKERHYYIFKEDSSQMFNGWENLEGKHVADAEYESIYKYSPPVLYLFQKDTPSKIVKYIDGKMYFFDIKAQNIVLNRN